MLLQTRVSRRGSPAWQSRRALSRLGARVTTSSSLPSFHRSRAPYRRFSWPVSIESLPLSSRMSRSAVRHSRVPCRQSQIAASASVRRGVTGERGTVSLAERPDHRKVPGCAPVGQTQLSRLKTSRFQARRSLYCPFVTSPFRQLGRQIIWLILSWISKKSRKLQARSQNSPAIVSLRLAIAVGCSVVSKRMSAWDPHRQRRYHRFATVQLFLF
jgi:hypothetical protein